MTIGAYAFDAFEAAYAATVPGLTLDSDPDPGRRRGRRPRMAHLCLLGAERASCTTSREPLIGGYLVRRSGDDRAVGDDAAGEQRRSQPIAVPVLVAQGAKDTLVEPSATEGFVDQTCTAGLAAIDFRLYPDATHGTIAFAAAPEVARFFASAIAGELRASDLRDAVVRADYSRAHAGSSGQSVSYSSSCARAGSARECGTGPRRTADTKSARVGMGGRSLTRSARHGCRSVT